MSTVAALDGSSRALDSAGGTGVHVFKTIDEIVSWQHDAFPTAPILVDVPIGLPERASLRACDVAARQLLGARRGSVFPVPDRGLFLPTFADVQAEIARRRTSDPKARGLSQQSFGIVRKIAEVDSFVRSHPDQARCVYEMHPELSFRTMAWRDLDRKVSDNGMKQRADAVDAQSSDVGLHLASALRPTLRSELKSDDVLDAYAALWTAQRVLAGLSCELGDGSVDAYGLPMRMLV